MATWKSSDIYANALRLGHIFQANPSWPWYNYYISDASKLSPSPNSGLFDDKQCQLPFHLRKAP